MNKTNLKPSVEFMPFEDWLKENDDLALEEFRTGSIDCPECDGTGTLYFESPDDTTFRRHMEVIYNEQREADSKKLNEWNRIVKEENIR